MRGCVAYLYLHETTHASTYIVETHDKADCGCLSSCTEYNQRIRSDRLVISRRLNIKCGCVIRLRLTGGQTFSCHSSLSLKYTSTSISRLSSLVSRLSSLLNTVQYSQSISVSVISGVYTSAYEYAPPRSPEPQWSLFYPTITNHSFSSARSSLSILFSIAFLLPPPSSLLRALFSLLVFCPLLSITFTCGVLIIFVSRANHQNPPHTTIRALRGCSWSRQNEL